MLRGDLEAVARLLEGEAEVRHSAGPGSLVARLDGLAAYSLPLIALGILAISLGARGFWGGWLPVDWNPKTSLRSICVGLLASAGGLIGLGGGIRAAFIALAFGAVASLSLAACSSGGGGFDTPAATQAPRKRSQLTVPSPPLPPPA